MHGRRVSQEIHRLFAQPQRNTVTHPNRRDHQLAAIIDLEVQPHLHTSASRARPKHPTGIFTQTDCPSWSGDASLPHSPMLA